MKNADKTGKNFLLKLLQSKTKEPSPKITSSQKTLSCALSFLIIGAFCATSTKCPHNEHFAPLDEKQLKGRLNPNEHREAIQYIQGLASNLYSGNQYEDTTASHRGKTTIAKPKKKTRKTKGSAKRLQKPPKTCDNDSVADNKAHLRKLLDDSCAMADQVIHELDHFDNQDNNEIEQQNAAEQSNALISWQQFKNAPEGIKQTTRETAARIGLYTGNDRIMVKQLRRIEEEQNKSSTSDEAQTPFVNFILRRPEHEKKTLRRGFNYNPNTAKHDLEIVDELGEQGLTF